MIIAIEGSWPALAILAAVISAFALSGRIAEAAQDRFMIDRSAGKRRIVRRWYATGRDVGVLAAHDTPFRVLAWENEDGPVWVKVERAGTGHPVPQWLPLTDLFPVVNVPYAPAGSAP